MDHLACYVPGMLALGVFHSAGKLHSDNNDPTQRVYTQKGEPDVKHFVQADRLLTALLSVPTDQEILRVAQGLLQTCISLYVSQPTTLGPERTLFKTTEHHEKSDHVLFGDKSKTKTSEEMQREREQFLPKFSVISPRYLLRPEVFESIFVFWRVLASVFNSFVSTSQSLTPFCKQITHDEYYRDVAWRLFEALETFCRTPVRLLIFFFIVVERRVKHSAQQSQAAFSGLTNVQTVPPVHDNSMQSFFFAGLSLAGLLSHEENEALTSRSPTETLKYLFLTFSDDSVCDLEKIVFTTEAHPLTILSS